MMCGRKEEQEVKNKEGVKSSDDFFFPKKKVAKSRSTLLTHRERAFESEIKKQYKNGEDDPTRRRKGMQSRIWTSKESFYLGSDI